MAIVPVNQFDRAGFFADRRTDSLPLQAFTDARNIRFKNGGAALTEGEVQVYATPSVEPLWAMQYRKVGEQPGWVYGGTQKLYAVLGTGEFNLTRQTASVDVNYSPYRWNGGVLGNVVIINNGADVPQSWVSLDTSVRMEDLANWPSGYVAKVIRPFRQYLLALYITKSGVAYPTTLLWSHVADPGTVPTSWDITDETKDAGETPVGQDYSFLVDAIPLRDAMVLYKESSVHLLRYIGGTFIFAITDLFHSFGIPAQDCAVEFKPGSHFAYTGDDLVVHDGQTFQSLLDGRAKTWLQRVDKTQVDKCFVVADKVNTEAWFCYPTAYGSGYGGRVQEALLWNWTTNVLSYRDLRKVNHLASGFVDSSQFVDDSYDAAVGIYDTDAQIYDATNVFLGSQQLLCCQTTRLALQNQGYESDSTALPGALARTGLGIAFKQNQPPDVTSMKFCREVWFRFTGDTGTELTITLGGQKEVDQPVEWRTPQTFTIGVSRKLNCTIAARTFAFRIESTAASRWELHGVEFNVSAAGTY